MNLLNVRFYLYERVLYHPTKCAAGAMLGTALQLLGIQAGAADAGGGDALPEGMRYLGDSVFLDQVYQAGRIALAAIREVTPASATGNNPSGETQWLDRALDLLKPKIDCPEFETARAFILKWRGHSAAEALEHMEAGCDLMCRLTSRRYYKVVFRNLPNAHNKLVKRKSEDLAKHFLDASVRYRVERTIESQAGLKHGSLVIHCPRMNTARKIANVLLVLPDADGDHGEVKKLRHVGELDPAVFGAHQTAIKAVEDMYRSMWRLAVYVAPEYLDRWEDIAKSAGNVIFSEFDLSGDYPGEQWQNDHHLIRELDRKYGRRDSPRLTREIRFPEIESLVNAGLLDTSSAQEELGRALRRQVVLNVVLPATGKERLERRDEKPFAEFIDQDILPMSQNQFVGWLQHVKTTFIAPQGELPLEGARHFKTGDISAVLDRLRETIKSFNQTP
jgi:hypothetical protein